MHRIYFLIFLVFLGAGSIVHAREAREVKTRLYPQKILMGEHVNLEFELEFTTGEMLVVPVLNEQIHEHIEILHYGTTDTLASGTPGMQRIKRSLRITSWQEGFHAIEPFTFMLVSNSDTLLLESEPALLEVEPFNIDEHTDLKDIKDLASAPLTFREILPWLVLALVLAAIVGALIYYYRKRKHKPQPQNIWQKPDIPAHVAAFNSLEKLREKKLWQQGKIKDYYSELSDILRMYLQKRYGTHALEMTTSEIMTALQGVMTDAQAAEILQQRLQLADLVKFAKFTPRESDNHESMDDGFAFVKITMLRETRDKAASDPDKND